MGARERLRELCARKAVSGADAARLVVCKGSDGYVVEDRREIVFMANTDHVDESGEIVVPSGAVPDSYFFTVKSVFVDHWYDFDRLIGTARTWAARPSAANHKYWEVRVRVHAKNNPLCDDVLTVAREAGIGCSIGFAPLNTRAPKPEDSPAYKAAATITDRWNWIELSVTAMPCNPYAGSMRLTDEDEKRLSAIDTLVTKGRVKRESAAAMGFPDRSKVVGKRIIVIG